MPLNQDPQIDWASRVDGEVHTLIRGEHFMSRKPSDVRRAASMYAVRHDLRCLTEIGRTDDGRDMLKLQFVPKVGKL